MATDAAHTYFPLSVSEQHRACVAAARLHNYLSREGALEMQRDSVYGAALVMPQFARSTGWLGNLSTLALRSYFFLIANISLQFFLVHSVIRVETVMDVIAGQMNLCDFGIGHTGPGGTEITKERLYSWSQWNTRVYVKDSFARLFPDREKDINDMIDPGEYGVESIHVRLVCALIFVMSGIADLYQVGNLLKILWTIPSQAASWMDIDGEAVILKIAGMPAHWKVVNIICVIFPKFCVWMFTCRVGIFFIMDTSAIIDTIINTTALSFILGIDELIFATLTTHQTRFMMQDLQSYSVEAEDEDQAMRSGSADNQADEEELIEQSGVQHWKLRRAFPRRLLLCLSLWILGISEYYIRKCVNVAGVLVSADMYTPKSEKISLWSAFLPDFFPIEHEGKPFWTMADAYSS